MGASNVVVDVGVGLTLLVTPFVLVWPRSYGRLLIPPAVRRQVAGRPLTWAAAIATLFALLTGTSITTWMLGGLFRYPPTAVHGGQSAAIIWLSVATLTATVPTYLIARTPPG